MDCGSRTYEYLKFTKNRHNPILLIFHYCVFQRMDVNLGRYPESRIIGSSTPLSLTMLADGRGGGVEKEGEESNHTTARRPGPL